MAAIEMRDLRQEDAEQVREWRNRPAVSWFMYTDHHITPEEHAAWFRRVTSDPSVRYWIIRCDGEDVGLANLYAIDERNSRCFWAFYVAEESARGKGVGSFVEHFVLRYVFEKLGMNKLCCEILASNPGVVEMHKSFGFKEEGYFRQHVGKGGASVDIHCLAMLREEWQELRGPIEERLRAKGLI